MKHCEKKSGFTLIELLVVVLIIGILSAIALPQYRMAVEKTRAAEVMINVRVFKEAIDRYYLATGEWPAGEESKRLADIAPMLDVALPTTLDGVVFKNVYVGIRPRKGAGYQLSMTLNSAAGKAFGRDGKITCATSEREATDSFPARICKALCGVSQLEKVWGSGEFGCVISS